MKAAIYEKPGLENLRVIGDSEQPYPSDHDILIKVKFKKGDQVIVQNKLFDTTCDVCQIALICY